MKRAGDLYGPIAEPENLRQAFLKAIRGKRGKAEVIVYTANLDRNLRLLRDQLLAGEVDVGHYHFFTVHEPKERLICAASFPERVLHHAIMNVCEPVLERYAIHDSYACRAGKGMHAAVLRAREFTRRYPWYLKLDIRKYFDSIPHAPLLRLLERRIKDKAVLRLITVIVGTHDAAGMDGAEAVPPGGESPDGAEAVPPASGWVEGRPPCRPIVTTGRGLPIGNLLSQHLANLYLGHFDHWVKETLQVRGYVRYMDDVVLWANEPSELKAHLRTLRAFLESELKLELKNNIQLNRCVRGLPFLGYRVFANRLTLGPKARRRFARRLRGYEQAYRQGHWSEADLQRHVEALLAYVSFADTLHLRRGILVRMKGVA
jgi:RNA-directed DNA polymerase